MEIKELQSMIEKFVKERNIGTSTQNRMLDLLSEAGELAKEILKSSDYGKKAFERNEAFDAEFGDVFFSLVCLANQTNLDLEDLMLRALEKYDQRFKDHQHIGSIDKKIN